MDPRLPPPGFGDKQGDAGGGRAAAGGGGVQEGEFRPDNISWVLGYDPIGQKRYQLTLRFGSCMHDSYS